MGKMGLNSGIVEIVVRSELRKKLLKTLQFDRNGVTEITAEIKLLRWPNITSEVEKSQKLCTLKQDGNV